MTTPLSSLTGNSSTTAAGGSTGTPQTALDQNSFLQLLVAQLSHQDPLQPQEGTEFIAQLATFAQVQQATNTNTKLDSLNAQLQGIASNDAASLVGRQVTVRGHGLAWDGTTAVSASATINGAADSVTAKILDANGNTVRTLHLPAMTQAGPVGITWNGQDDHGNPVARGNYTLQIDATNHGTAVDTTSDVSGVVQRVSYDRGYPELLLDSGVTAPISDLVAVGVAPSTGAATTAAGAPAGTAAALARFSTLTPAATSLGATLSGSM